MTDALFLSRLQFGWVMSFHILFPAFTIGLASWIVFLEAWWLKTRSEHVRDLVFFWMKIFAVSFGVGVVSGIVMSFQFGTNWARFSAQAGNVIGPLLNYEVLTAFFVEASFLGIMLFGWNRVGHKTHFACTCMVAVGTLASTFWIMSANSWMQTPAGYRLTNGVFYPVNWWRIVFNPSFPVRLVHMALAAFLTTAFMIGGISAYYLLRHRFIDKARLCFKCALVFVAIVAPLQIVVGDRNGDEVLRDQPAKLAALEGIWDSGRNVPWVLFAIPNARTESNDYAVDIPHGGSLILTHSWSGAVQGLKSFPSNDRPPVAIPFYSFRIMVALGVLMVLMAWYGLWKWRRGTLMASRAYQRAWIWMMPSGFIALLCGWYVAEVGRQPWVVYGVMRTADAVSPVPAGSVAASLIVYILVYVALFGFVGWYLLKMLRVGPVAAPQRTRTAATAARPLSLADRDAGEWP
ncbi:MAG TPA: cytochrome ubiquinol oxidase subunit I [Rhodanobacteraceae bacterium]|nr:cytochrome ubiquinol oxidase subunit I [Rhodanobacteraceae bacterium]